MHNVPFYVALYISGVSYRLTSLAAVSQGELCQASQSHQALLIALCDGAARGNSDVRTPLRGRSSQCTTNHPSVFLTVSYC